MRRISSLAASNRMSLSRTPRASSCNAARRALLSRDRPDLPRPAFLHLETCSGCRCRHVDGIAEALDQSRENPPRRVAAAGGARIALTQHSNGSQAPAIRSPGRRARSGIRRVSLVMAVPMCRGSAVRSNIRRTDESSRGNSAGSAPFILTSRAFAFERVELATLSTRSASARHVSRRPR